MLGIMMNDLLMNAFANVILIVDTISIVSVAIYGYMQLHLLSCTKKNGTSQETEEEQHKSVANPSEPPPGSYRFVTIQLPLYNELFVVDRLIDNIMKMDWPKDSFEVQVLDDSTDETVEAVSRKVAEYQAQGFMIEQLRRPSRHGYKAGALEDHLNKAQGDFIAYFDADFLPRPDFLKKTMPYFDDPKTCLVQTRWEHLNADYNTLTRLQTYPLNLHFRVEQPGRCQGNFLCQFNGTAGLWRKAAISDSGGWSSETLTEDVDLSIRAQLRGWEFQYVEEIGCPAEIPASIHSLKTQQWRWMKGMAQTARKLLPTILLSNLNFGQKMHIALKLVESSTFVFMFLMGLLSVPAMFVFGESSSTVDILAGLSASNCLSQLFCLWAANVTRPAREEGGYWNKVGLFIFWVPIYICVIQAMSLHNSIAVYQGYFLDGHSEFVRTPKLNIQKSSDKISHGKKYQANKIGRIEWLEMLLCVYFSTAFLYGWQSENYSFLPLHFTNAVGYGMVVYYNFQHLLSPC